MILNHESPSDLCIDISGYCVTNISISISTLDHGDSKSSLMNTTFESSKFQKLMVSNLLIPSTSDQNLEISQEYTMKLDCEESSSTNLSSSNHEDTIKLLTTISTQMASSYHDLQDRIQQNDLQL